MGLRHRTGMAAAPGYRCISECRTSKIEIGSRLHDQEVRGDLQVEERGIE